jgi:TIR domain
LLAKPPGGDQNHRVSTDSGVARPKLRIFLNYRRDDSSGYALSLYHDLADHFGADQVFMDIDTIAPGENFVSRIEETMSTCDVVVALIGRDWLTAADVNGNRRLDDPADFVRLELESAIERNVPLVPTLVHSGRIPQANDLPDSLRPLVLRQGIELHDSTWRTDVARLIKVLERLAAPPDPAATRTKHGPAANDETKPTVAPTKADDIATTIGSRLARLSRAEQVVGAAMFFVFVAFFLPWYEISAPAVSASRSAAAAGGFRYLILVLTIALLIYLTARTLGFVTIGRGHTGRLAKLAAVGLNALFIVIAFFVQPGFGPGLSQLAVGWSYGAYIALSAGLIALAAAWQDTRTR